MKLIYSLLYFVVIVVGIVGHYAHSCPLCVGKLEGDSPVFFSDEYYQAAEIDKTHTQISQPENHKKNDDQTHKEVQS